jgi:YfiH family protein
VFAHHEVRVGIGCAVTDRFGGVSAAPYDELNLADHVGDDPAAVTTNRRRLVDALELDAVAYMHQVHGHDVAVINAAFDDPPTADALVTTTPGLALGVLVADCTPVLLWDRRAGVIGVAHVGRRGLAAGVVAATVDVMTRKGARHDRVYAHVGPAICPEHYEVPVEMRDEVGALVRDSATTTRDGRPAINIRHGIAAQLIDCGVRRLAVSSTCTAEQTDYYSYRRDGATGRFAGLVWMS